MRKRSAKKPPLSALDKTVYLVGILLGFAAMMGVMIFFGQTLPEHIAVSDPTVVEYDCGSDGLLLSMPFAIILDFVILIPCCYGLQLHQPIFGNRNYRPSPFRAVIRETPIFSKRFRKTLSARAVKRARTFAVVSLVALLVSGALLPLGLFSRTVLDAEGEFVTYDALNRATDVRSLGDAERMTVEIDRYASRRSIGRPYIHVSYEYPDRTVTVPSSAEKQDDESRLKLLLARKELFGDRFTAYGLDLIDDLIAEQGYTDREAELVYALFGVAG